MKLHLFCIKCRHFFFMPLTVRWRRQQGGRLVSSVFIEWPTTLWRINIISHLSRCLRQPGPETRHFDLITGSNRQIDNIRGVTVVASWPERPQYSAYSVFEWRRDPSRSSYNRNSLIQEHQQLLNWNCVIISGPGFGKRSEIGMLAIATWNKECATRDQEKVLHLQGRTSLDGWPPGRERADGEA